MITTSISFKVRIGGSAYIPAETIEEAREIAKRHPGSKIDKTTITVEEIPEMRWKLGDEFTLLEGSGNEKAGDICRVIGLGSHSVKYTNLNRDSLHEFRPDSPFAKNSISRI